MDPSQFTTICLGWKELGVDIIDNTRKQGLIGIVDHLEEVPVHLVYYQIRSINYTVFRVRQVTFLPSYPPNFHACVPPWCENRSVLGITCLLTHAISLANDSEVRIHRNSEVLVQPNLGIGCLQKKKTTTFYLETVF